MLEAARAAQGAGTDVVVGYIEPHGRVETERLAGRSRATAALPVALPRHRAAVNSISTPRWRGSRAILLVDELAHSNIVGGEPAPRHPKRWQDIEELLDAGINVWTTVNVQHLESLNDLVFQITGVRQRETAAGPGIRSRPMRSSSSICRPMICSRGCVPGRSMSPTRWRRGRAILPQAESHGLARARVAQGRVPRGSCLARAAFGATTSFKLEWSEKAEAFVLPKTGETLKEVVERVINQHFGVDAGEGGAVSLH